VDEEEAARRGDASPHGRGAARRGVAFRRTPCGRRGHGHAEAEPETETSGDGMARGKPVTSLD
jgi:hypothetical protein